MTKITKKSVKKVTKVVHDYKQMYGSLRTLADNLKEELDYETDLRINRGVMIDLLQGKLDKAETVTFVVSLVCLFIGIAIGVYF